MAKWLCTAAMTLFISAIVASPLELEMRQTGQCSGLHVMAAGGCHLPCTSDTLSFLSTTVAGITIEIPDSDLYLVPYDGSAKQAAVSSIILNQAIAQYTQECPNTPIVLVGYSLGGIVITNSLCGPVPYSPNIIASVTYGEETFAYPTSYDRGTCRANAPLYARADTAACGTFAPIMRSYCDALDPNCCSTGNIDDNSAHFEYAGHYDTEVAAYVLSQYNDFIAEQVTANSTTASAAPSSLAIYSSFTHSTPFTSSTHSSPAFSSTASSAAFSPTPIYANCSNPADTMTASNHNNAINCVGTSLTLSSVVAPTSNGIANSAQRQTSIIPVSVESVTRIDTRTITNAAKTTTIPVYMPSGLTTPTSPPETAVPNSAAYESVYAQSGAAQVVPVGSGSGIAIAPSVAPTRAMTSGPLRPVSTGAAQSGAVGSGSGTANITSLALTTAVPVHPHSPASSGGIIPVNGLTPFNPNGAALLALPSSMIAYALITIGFLV